MIALICAIILGFTSIYLWDKFPYLWIIFAIAGAFYLVVHKREVWVRGPWTPINMRERLSRDTTAPTSAITAIQERYALNKEARVEQPQPYRMREIAKRLIFLDGYVAAKKQGGTS